MTGLEIGIAADYFHNPTPEHLETRGVDPDNRKAGGRG
jgi:hypothetical protein